MRKYQIEHAIGTGNFSSVFKGLILPQRTPCAIKIMKSHRNIALRQAQMLKIMKHPNVVSILDFQQTENESRLVLQYIGINTLELYEAQSYGLREEQVKCILFQAALGLACVHSFHIIHRDIKPENILIDKKTAIVKLIDFGLSIDESKCSTDYIATRWYRAPENLLGTREYGCAIDVFSLGCVIVELYLGSPLFPGSNNMDQLFKIFNILGYPSQESWAKGYERMRQLSIVPSSKERQVGMDLKTAMNPCDSRLIDIVSKMLELNPKKRITSMEILKHQYFSDVRSIVPPVVYQRYEQDVLNLGSKNLSGKNLGNAKSSKNMNFEALANGNRKSARLNIQNMNNFKPPKEQKNIQSPQFLRIKKSSSLESRNYSKQQTKPFKSPNIKEKAQPTTILKRKISIPSLFPPPTPNSQHQSTRIPSIFKQNKAKSPMEDEAIPKKQLQEIKNLNQTIHEDNNGIGEMKSSHLTPDASQTTTISQISKIHTPTTNLQVQNKTFSSFNQTQSVRNKFYPLIPFVQYIAEPVEAHTSIRKISIPATMSQPQSQIHPDLGPLPRSQINLSIKTDISNQTARKFSNVLPAAGGANLGSRNANQGYHPVRKAHQPFYYPLKEPVGSQRLKYISPNSKLRPVEPVHVPPKPNNLDSLSSRQAISPSYRYFPASPQNKLSFGSQQRLVAINSPPPEFKSSQFKSPGHRK